jgi:hypothetical protein
VAAGVPVGLLERRYGTPVDLIAVERRSDLVGTIPDATTWLEAASGRHTSGDTARMAQRLLDDFRRGVLGPIALELPGAVHVAEPVAAPEPKLEPVLDREPLPDRARGRPAIAFRIPASGGKNPLAGGWHCPA